MVCLFACFVSVHFGLLVENVEPPLWLLTITEQRNSVDSVTAFGELYSSLLSLQKIP